ETYITRLAWRLEVFRLDPQVPPTCAHIPIDLTILLCIGLVQRTAGGRFALTQPLEPLVAPQVGTLIAQKGTEEGELEGSAAGPADLGGASMDSDPHTPASPKIVPTLQSLQAAITDMGQMLDMMRQEQIS